MGNIRRIKKQLKQPIAMANTKMTVNGCQVFLAHPNPTVAKKSAEKFVGFMNYLNERARLVNIRDLYEAHFQLLQKLAAGEDLIKAAEEVNNVNADESKAKSDTN